MKDWLTESASIKYTHQQRSTKPALELTIKTSGDSPPMNSNFVFKLPPTESLSLDGLRFPALIRIYDERTTPNISDSVSNRLRSRVVVLWSDTLLCCRPHKWEVDAMFFDSPSAVQCKIGCSLPARDRSLERVPMAASSKPGKARETALLQKL